MEEIGSLIQISRVLLEKLLSSFIGSLIQIKGTIPLIPLFINSIASVDPSVIRNHIVTLLELD